MLCPHKSISLQPSILVAVYRWKAYMIKYKSKKRLNKRLSLNYKHLLKYTFDYIVVSYLKSIQIHTLCYATI